MLYKITQFLLFWSAVMTKSSNSRIPKKRPQRKRNENAYIIFSNFFRNTLAKELCIDSKNILKEAGKFWGSLPNELKNQFTTYANRKRLLKKIREGCAIAGKEDNFKSANSTLCIIYDDLVSLNSTTELNRTPNFLSEPCSPSKDDSKYDQIFSSYINY
jgi:hypothetical protein